MNLVRISEVLRFKVLELVIYFLLQIRVILPDPDPIFVNVQVSRFDLKINKMSKKLSEIFSNVL